MNRPPVLEKKEGGKPFLPPPSGRAACRALQSFLFSPARTHLNIAYADLSTPPDVCWVAATKDGDPLAWRSCAPMASIRAAARPWTRPVVEWDESCGRHLPPGIPLVPLRRILGDWLGQDYSLWRDPFLYGEQQKSILTQKKFFGITICMFALQIHS